MTLLAGATMATDAIAQQCCSRRPILRRNCCTTCSMPTSISTQATATTYVANPLSSVPTNYAPTFNYAAPSSGCCGQTGVIASPQFSAATSTFPTSSTAGIVTSDPGIVAMNSPSTLTQSEYVPGTEIGQPITNDATLTAIPSADSTAGNPVVSDNAIVSGNPVVTDNTIVGVAPIASTVGPTIVQPHIPVANSVPAPYVMPTYTQTSMQVSQQFVQPSVQPTMRGNIASGIAQRKAQRAAQMRLRGHLGGSLGGAAYEGVGWSNVSPQRAIQSCCYWGQRAPVDIGVARGNDGCWYACVLYR